MWKQAVVNVSESGRDMSHSGPGSDGVGSDNVVESGQNRSVSARLHASRHGLSTRHTM